MIDYAEKNYKRSRVLRLLWMFRKRKAHRNETQNQFRIVNRAGIEYIEAAPREG